MIAILTRKQHNEAHTRTKPQGIFKGQLPKKVVFIKADPKKFQQQKEDMEMIERLSKEIITADTHEDVMIKTAIAVGYVNAMKIHGVIDDKETSDLVDMLGTIGEDKLQEMERLNLRIIMRNIRKKV